MNLTLTVTKQKLAKGNDSDWSSLVHGTEGYVNFKFLFDETWMDCAKAAVFSAEDDDIDESAQPILNDTCPLPEDIADCTKFKIYVVGVRPGLRLTTNTVEVRQK